MNVIQNTSASVAFECSIDGVAYDLSGASEIEIAIKDINSVLFTKTLSDGEVMLSGDDNEIATAVFPPSEAIQLAPGFGKVQIRVRNGDTVIGEVAKTVLIAQSLSQEAL